MLLKVNMKRKGALGGIWEFAIYVGLALLTIATVLVGYPAYKNYTNRTVCYDEMRMIQAASVSYASAAVSNRAPDDLSTLFANPSLSADDSIDGADHENFLTPKKFTNTSTNNGDVQVNDPWGKPYEYSVDSTGTVTLTSTGSGSDITKTW